MKNIPALVSNSHKISASFASEDKVARVVGQAVSTVAEADASVVELNRARPKPMTDQGVEKTLDSFLSQVTDSKSLVSAHAGLDPARVAELLGD